MASLRLVLDPEREGLGIAYSGDLVHLADDAEIVITGLHDGMQATDGNPSRASMALAFKLPSGDLVIAETSWRLFASAYHAFLGKFGEPDMSGMRVEIPEDGRTLEFVSSEKPFVQCGECGWRLDGVNTEASVEHLVREYERHYRKKHRGIPSPPPFPERN